MTQRTDAQLKTDGTTYINNNTTGDVTPSDVRAVIDNVIDSKINNDKFTANTVLYATLSATPVALTVGEQRVIGRASGSNISALLIDSELSSVSATHNTIPSAKAVKDYIDNNMMGAMFRYNAQIIEADKTLDADKNYMSIGPVAIASGITIQVLSGSVWTII